MTRDAPATLRPYLPLVDDSDAFLAACRRPLPRCIAVHELRTSPLALQERLQRLGVQTTALAWDAGALRWPDDGPAPTLLLEHRAGLFWPQEEAARIAVRLLDPQPGDYVLDLCAAPGNKTAQIALALRDEGTVVANDRRPARMASLGATLGRLSLLSVCRTMHDGVRFPMQVRSFDRVLVDAPCSCLGTLRKSPEVLTRWSPAASRERARLQLALLRRGADLCRPGGRLVYATCTFAPEENEAVLAALLAERDDLRLLPTAIAKLKTHPGLTEWQGELFPGQLRHALRLWPHDNDTGGFFCAALERSQ